MKTKSSMLYLQSKPSLAKFKFVSAISNLLILKGHHLCMGLFNIFKGQEMTKNAIISLHNEIKDQFDVMHDLVAEIKRLEAAGDTAQANKLADILNRLSAKAYRMNQIVREAA